MIQEDVGSGVESWEIMSHHTSDNSWLGHEGWFDPSATEVAFPLGGIGTGNISLGARGDLRDFEIWNEPRKGLVLPYTHFAVWAQQEGEQSVTRLLEGPVPPPYSASHGIHPNHGGGLPRFAGSRFRGQYPVAELALRDPDVPVEVDLLAYTPLVPLEADDSGLPCIVFRWRVTNPGPRPVQATVVASLLNPAGYAGVDEFGNLRSNPDGDPRNSWREAEGLRGVFFEGPPAGSTDLTFGSAALATIETETTAKVAWQQGGWYDALREFWSDLAADGMLSAPAERAEWTAIGPRAANVDPGSLGTPLSLASGESRTTTFILCWHFPNRVNGWSAAAPGVPPTTRVRYAARFADAWAVAGYAAQHLARLEHATLAFRGALFGSTLPQAVLDALSSNVATLRSNTCFWLANGSFFGWEGCFDRGGSCHGNCTHVWNYAQTLAFLFPALEISMLRTAFLDEVDDAGMMRFRTERPFGSLFAVPHAAADGQLGMVIRLWRAFTLTGDRSLLRELWPNVQKTLRYAMETWDTDGDGVPDGQQHNTYDIEFYGPNPLTGVMMIGALKAAAAIAERLEDEGAAIRYREAANRGAARLEELTWNGEYYRQLLDDVDSHPYQFGEGCLSDQLLGQQLAHVAGLGHLLPADHVRSAIESVWRYNFRHPLGMHVNLQRSFAMPDESGLLLCSWPRGGEPRLPFVYSDEVWTGTEYQVASHLIYEGEAAKGIEVAAAVRERYDGYRRNPWDEVECGHHYARSMASWALLPALTGFTCDAERKLLCFRPAMTQASFSVLFTCGAGWGLFTQVRTEAGRGQSRITVLGGDLEGYRIDAAD